ncbi:MAG: hypothetical protein DDT24_00647 [Chloroflexi bacterium]|nr:hypothetical protein [Chloroflexota bacterium]
MGIAIDSLHLERAITQLQDRDIERSASEVVHRDGLILLLIQTIGHRGCGGLVDYAKHIESGDNSRILGRLALAVVEISRHGDHRVGHFLPKVSLGVGLEFLQYHRRDFSGTIVLIPHLHPGIAIGSLSDFIGQHLLIVFNRRLLELAPHESLDAENGIIGIDNRLTLGNLSRQALPALADCHHRGRGASPFGAGDHRRFTPLHHRHTTISCPQIDTDYFTHFPILLFSRQSGV